MIEPVRLFARVAGCAMLALGGACLYASACSRGLSAPLFIMGAVLLGVGAGIVSWLADG